MELSIQERLKDLRVSVGWRWNSLRSRRTSPSRRWAVMRGIISRTSAIMPYWVGKVLWSDCWLFTGAFSNKNHPNADLADLRLSDDMIELLKSGLVDNSLLCELAVHPDFPRLMADLEIYVNGTQSSRYRAQMPLWILWAQPLWSSTIPACPTRS